MDTIFTDGQLMKAIRTMRQKGMTPERLNRILGSGIFADVCDVNADLGDREAVRAALKLGVYTPEMFRLNVGYYRYSLSQMIIAGRYGIVSDNITDEYFPTTRLDDIALRARYFHFNRKLTAEAAIVEMRAEGWEPASIRCLLSHGMNHPEEQRKYRIVGLGSIAMINGSQHVPALDEEGSERRLYLTWSDGGLDPDTRCLAVREPVRARS
jgi:hypothetical protein